MSASRGFRDRERENRIEQATAHARQIERIVYREVSEAETPNEVAEADALRRIVVGLRRKLEGYRRN